MVYLDGKLLIIILTVLTSHWINGKVSIEDIGKKMGKKVPPDNPCNFKPFEIPAFNATGRRKCESKCYEYIWKMKKEIYDFEKNEECADYAHQLIHISPAVLGGRKAIVGEFPHMGAVGWRSKVGTWIFKCGSGLISPKFMLTAAHCSKASPREINIANLTPEIVRLGSLLIRRKIPRGSFTYDVKILRIIVHPQYIPPKKYFDIAIIELERPLTFTIDIKPACLWSQLDTRVLEKNVTVTGWGVTQIEYGISAQESAELLAANVDIIASEFCDKLLKPFCNRLWSGLSDSQICAGKLAGGVDTCQGDSGGPLQAKLSLPINKNETVYYLVGITSFGFGCGKQNQPGVYTRVSEFLDWIENIVWADSD